MNTISDSITTPLGEVVTKLEINNDSIELLWKKPYPNARSEVYRTDSFFIEKLYFDVDPTIKKYDLQGWHGWIWRMEKRTNISEKLKISCELVTKEHLQYDITSGDKLEAFEASNKHTILHIGTEDAEAMSKRAADNIWLPPRLAEQITFETPLSVAYEGKIKTRVPADLQKPEQFYVQYICAYAKKTPKAQSEDSWLAVDFDFEELEDWVGF